MVATSARIAAPIFAEEYFATCDLERSELIDGKVQEVEHASFRHSVIVGTIGVFLLDYARKTRSGIAAVRSGCVLRRNLDTVIFPDVSFVENARLAG